MANKSPRNRRAVIEPLEARLLFSATADIAVLDDGNSDVAQLVNAAANTDLTLIYPNQDIALTGFTETPEQVTALDSGGIGEPVQPPTEIVFIDTSVNNYQLLLDDILQNSAHNKVAVVLLDQDLDGVEQITASLANYSGLGAVHLISHGTAGSVQLGSASVNQHTLSGYDQEFISWRQALSDDADILIYGCNLASSASGLQLVEQLAALTQADIAASNDLTGHQTRSGDWDLEVKHGEINTDVIVSEAAQASWHGTLSHVVYESTGGAVPANVTGISSSQSAWQTFTVTEPGGYTTDSIFLQLRLSVAPVDPTPQTVTVSLFSNFDGTGTAIALGSDTLSSNDLTTTLSWQEFNFNGVALTSGETYYIKVAADGLNPDPLVVVGVHETNPYGQGEYLNNNGIANPSNDLAFEVAFSGTHNNPTVANPIADQSATEQQAFNYTVPANTFAGVNPGDTLTYSAQLAAGAGALPAWLTFDAATHTFSGMPDNGDVGVISIEVTADNGYGGTVTDTFDITIANVNDAPTLINVIPDQVATEDIAFNFTFAANTFNDIDNTLTYSAQLSGGGTLPAWLNFDAATRTFSGTPANGDVGIISLDVTADDGSGGFITDTFTLVVSSGDSHYVDTGNGPHFYPVSSINQLGQSFMFDSAGTTYTVNEISLYLARYASAVEQTITLELRDAWNGNIIASDSIFSSQISPYGFEWHSFAFPEVELNDSQNYIIQITSSADDDSILVSRFAADVYADGALIQNGVPNAAGWDLAFKLSYENGLNNAPTLDNPLADQLIDAELPFELVVPANTFSDANVNDTLSYRAQLAGGGSLGWLTFNEITRTFAGTPHWHQAGSLQVELIATDNHGASTSAFFAIEVVNTNIAPTVANAIPDQGATEDSIFNFQFSNNTFNDADVGTTFNYTAQLTGGGNLPAWLTFDASTRSFSGTPVNSDVGTLSIDVIANDGFGGSVTDTFIITIANTNDNPTVATAIPNQTATEDAAFTFTFAANTFADVDVGDSLTYTAQLSGGGVLPAWLNFDAATRTFSGTPTHDDLGTLSLDVIADDGKGGRVTGTFDILVENFNDVPTTIGIADIFNFENSSGDVVNLLSAFADEEDAVEQLIFTVVNNTNPTLITNTAINSVDGSLQLNYAANTFGSGVITLRAMDSGGAVVETSFVINIAHINASPVASGLPDISATTVTPPTVVNLKDFFADAEDGTDLIYSVVANTNDALAQLIALDSTTGILTLSYSPNTVGETTIRLRATDSEGAWIEASFNVSVLTVAQPAPEPPVIQQPTSPTQPVDNSARPPAVPVAGTPPTPGAPEDKLDKPPTVIIPGDVTTDIPVPADSLHSLVNNLGSAPTLLTPAQFNEGAIDADRNRPEWTDKQKEMDDQARQQANPYSSLAGLIAPESGYLDPQELIAFNDEVNRARSEMTLVLEEQQQQQAMIAGITISVTTGILIWSLRASSLFLTLFSMLPLWKGLDPLPVLDQVNKRKKELEQQRKDKAQEDRNAKEVGYLFDHSERKSR